MNLTGASAGACLGVLLALGLSCMASSESCDPIACTASTNVSFSSPITSPYRLRIVLGNAMDERSCPGPQPGGGALSISCSMSGFSVQGDALNDHPLGAGISTVPGVAPTVRMIDLHLIGNHGGANCNGPCRIRVGRLQIEP